MFVGFEIEIHFALFWICNSKKTLKNNERMIIVKSIDTSNENSTPIWRSEDKKRFTMQILQDSKNKYELKSIVHRA